MLPRNHLNVLMFVCMGMLETFIYTHKNESRMDKKIHGNTVSIDPELAQNTRCNCIFLAVRKIMMTLQSYPIAVIVLFHGMFYFSFYCQ